MSDVILSTQSLGFQWKTADPFLFCVHHSDDYPAGDDAMGPAEPLRGRNIGQDFSGKDGWSMYHGRTIPGFPQHPHRGFETVTIARQGYIDHSDSMGARARFGNGDVQWMTAGKGIVHSEMFPLVNTDKKNPTELFQIWLNLPRAKKMVDPHFTMHWSENIPTQHVTDDQGKITSVTIIAGTLDGLSAGSPPPHSLASDPTADVAIWTLKLEPGATWTLPAAASGLYRSLFFFSGQSMRIAGQKIRSKTGLQLRSDAPVVLQNGSKPAELLLLQGRPLGEPVVQHGPFVMNSPQEIQQAFTDYQRTKFGGWPWPDPGPAHDRDAARFAQHADGHEEHPERV